MSKFDDPDYPLMKALYLDHFVKLEKKNEELERENEKLKRGFKGALKLVDTDFDVSPFCELNAQDVSQLLLFQCDTHLTLFYVSCCEGESCKDRLMKYYETACKCCNGKCGASLICSKNLFK